MKSSMPIGEINLDEINKSAKKNREKLLEKREEDLKEKIKELNQSSLNDLANNTKNGKYRPYLLDFKFVLDRIKGESTLDSYDESLQIKIDIAEQLLKMKEVPSLSTECHIESRHFDKNTSIKSLILKKIFREKKYRLIFHGKDAMFCKKFYKVNVLKRIFALACFEGVMCILAFVISSLILLKVSILMMIITMILLV